MARHTPPAKTKRKPCPSKLTVATAPVWALPSYGSRSAAAQLAV
jgi:hypothetical protein